MKEELSAEQREKLFTTLRLRFEKNMNRHKDIKWSDVKKKLDASSEKISSLSEMERTGGEPDVVGYDKKTDEYIFYDCVIESPAGRRSCCYDRSSEEARNKKGVYPAGNVLDLVNEMSIELLTEQQYLELQQLGEFDLKTSSWLKTPSEVRKLGGAIFGDRRYNRVFTYHNGAPSFYAARGFRGTVRV